MSDVTVFSIKHKKHPVTYFQISPSKNKKMAFISYRNVWNVKKVTSWKDLGALFCTATVKFLIVAASPIEAAPQTFEKKKKNLQKVSYFENFQLKPHGDF